MEKCSVNKNAEIYLDIQWSPALIHLSIWMYEVGSVMVVKINKDLVLKWYPWENASVWLIVEWVTVDSLTSFISHVRGWRKLKWRWSYWQIMNTVQCHQDVNNPSYQQEISQKFEAKQWPTSAVHARNSICPRGLHNYWLSKTWTCALPECFFHILPISWLLLSIILWSHIVLIVVVHTMYMYFYNCPWFVDWLA